MLLLLSFVGGGRDSWLDRPDSGAWFCRRQGSHSAPSRVTSSPAAFRSRAVVSGWAPCGGGSAGSAGAGRLPERKWSPGVVVWGTMRGWRGSKVGENGGHAVHVPALPLPRASGGGAFGVRRGERSPAAETQWQSAQASGPGTGGASPSSRRQADRLTLP